MEGGGKLEGGPERINTSREEKKEGRPDGSLYFGKKRNAALKEAPAP